MAELREYIAALRDIELENVCLLVHHNLSPNLVKYVKLIQNAVFGDGTYTTYYGELKKLVSSFASYYNEKMDNTVKEVDKFMNISTRETLLELCNRTIRSFLNKENDFASEYTANATPAELERFKAISKKSAVYISKLYELHEEVSKLDKQFKIEAFTAKMLPLSLKCDYDRFKFTHMFISRMLARRVTNIDTSISEVMIKICHVFKQLQTQCEEAVNSLLHQLYNVNKESLRLQRKNRRCTIDSAEVDKSIQLIRQKIDEFYPQDTPLRRLQEEIQYWTRRSQEMDYIATALIKLRAEINALEKKEQKHLLNKKTDVCDCFPEDDRLNSDDELLTLNIVQARIVEVRAKYDQVARCLFTFFTVRGSNLVFYRDQIGRYYIDEYGHKIYSFDYGLEQCCLQEDGTFVDATEIMHKYFDEYGKYVFDESIKDISLVTNSTPYSSSQESLFNVDSNEGDIMDAELSVKVKSKAKVTATCAEELSIAKQLDKESTNYLWESFGSILPDALFDVYRMQPKNPIRCLAHALLRRKYTRTKTQTKRMEKEAQLYKVERLKQENREAEEVALAWKSKLVKRRKPEESYDTENQMIDTGTLQQHDFIMGYNFINEVM